jgi:hypothetical protein
MTAIVLISLGAISEALAFSLGILVGLQIAKERKNDSDNDKRKKETQRELDQRDPAWWHRVDVERRGFKGGIGDGRQSD